MTIKLSESIFIKLDHVKIPKSFFNLKQLFFFQKADGPCAWSSFGFSAVTV